MITDSDRNAIVYFIKEKGDITRWCDWKEKKEEIEKKYPELIAALKNVTIAERTLAAVVKTIEDDIIVY